MLSEQQQTMQKRYEEHKNNPDVRNFRSLLEGLIDSGCKVVLDTSSEGIKVDKIEPRINYHLY